MPLRHVGISLMTLQRWIANEDIQGSEVANCEWAGNEDLGMRRFGEVTAS